MPPSKRDLSIGVLKSIERLSGLKLIGRVPMHYHAKIEREGRNWNAVFMDAPGCVTFASSHAKALAAAKEAIEGWLEAHLLDGRAPPKPTPSQEAELIEIDPQLAVAVTLRWARQEAGLT